MGKASIRIIGLLAVLTQVAHGAATAGSQCQPITRPVVSRCGCQVLDRQDPRPELNPPRDIASLPEREQRKFVKIFELVPDQVKVKSTQNYAQRMVFAQSKQYAAITAKLRQRLERSGKRLAEEPVVTADEVLRACDETITYGRILTMGNMSDATLDDIAARYGFKNAAKVVERINDSKNLKRGLADGWPENDPECVAFARLAQSANAVQWRVFLDRATKLQEVFSANAGKARRASDKASTKKQVYDEYDVTAHAETPADIASLPRRDRVRFTKTFELLPVRVRGYAGQDYPARRAFFDSSAYRAIRQKLSERLMQEMPRLKADPEVSAEEILAMCDETVRFGRSLTMGDMRDVSLQDLATRYRFPAVSEFIRRADEERNAKTGFKDAYPEDVFEFEDFEILAKKANLKRWQDFRSRVAGYNRIYRQKKRDDSRVRRNRRQ